MKRVGASVCGAPTLLNTESTDRTDGFRVQNKNALGKAESVSFGSGRRIRTVTENRKHIVGQRRWEACAKACVKLCVILVELVHGIGLRFDVLGGEMCVYLVHYLKV